MMRVVNNLVLAAPRTHARIVCAFVCGGAEESKEPATFLLYGVLL